MNQLIEKAFGSLALTCNISSLHPSDEDRIKVTLRALHKNGVVIDATYLGQWLLNNDWQEKPVKDIVSWAEAVSSGGRVQLKYKNLAPTEKEVWQRLKG